MSHVLLPQDLGDVRVDLGVYALDVQKVPVLIGIRTLRSLRAVIDFDQDTAVFAALDPAGRPVRLSRRETEAQIESNGVGAVFTVAEELPDVAAPDVPTEPPAVLFHSRGSIGASRVPEDSVSEDPLQILRLLHANELLSEIQTHSP